jgi:hypothetical protein
VPSERTKEILARLRGITQSNGSKRRYVNEVGGAAALNSWHCIRTRHLQVEGRMVPLSAAILIEWCEQNCADFFIYYTAHLYFKDPSDAAYFLLVWEQ